MPWNGDPPTAEEVLDLIRRMTPGERERLAEALSYCPNALGHYVCWPEWLADCYREAAANLGRASRVATDVAKLADQQRRNRNRKPSQTSVALRAEATRLKGEDLTWRRVAERLWQEHPEWFPNDPRPEALKNSRGRRDDLVSRLTERIRYLCRAKRRSK